MTSRALSANLSSHAPNGLFRLASSDSLRYQPELAVTFDPTRPSSVNNGKDPVLEHLPIFSMKTSVGKEERHCVARLTHSPGRDAAAAW